MAMKRLATFSAILILSAAAALAQSRPSSTRFSNPLLDDVVRMTKAGMSDAAIVAYVKARRARIDSMSPDDSIQMRRAGVGEPVIQYLAGLAALDEGRSAEARQGDVAYDAEDGTAHPVEGDLRRGLRLSLRVRVLADTDTGRTGFRVRSSSRGGRSSVTASSSGGRSSIIGSPPASRRPSLPLPEAVPPSSVAFRSPCRPPLLLPRAEVARPARGPAIGCLWPIEFTSPR